MLIARQKEKENIAEYIIYMYQVEDLLRSYNFDVEALINQYIRPQIQDAKILAEYKEWYDNLVESMQYQKIEKSGHLIELNEILMELAYLHNILLTQANDDKYQVLTDTAQPFIEDFKSKSNLKDKNNIEIILNALYMKMLLRMKKQEISNETEEALDAMRAQLAYLTRAYHQMKRGELNFFNN